MYLQMRHSSQETESRIFTINICGQMKIHMQFFHHVTISSSPSISGPVFVVVIYSDSTFFPNRLTGRNYKAFLENNMPDFWLTCH
jgi:hypothetical protein